MLKISELVYQPLKWVQPSMNQKFDLLTNNQHAAAT